MASEADVKTKLSPKMADALARANEHGSLERWHGGWWTFHGCEFKCGTGQLSGYRIPKWHVTVGTIYALMDRGLLARCDASPCLSRVEPVAK